MNVIVLGGGLIGSPMAVDLSKDADIQVTVVDINEEILTKLKKIKGIETVRHDLSDTGRLKTLISDFDMVVSSVPGSMGYKILKTIIETGKNVVDIAFFPEEALELDSLAKQHSVTAVVGCGVAPGMSNMLTGYADHLLDKYDPVSKVHSMARTTGYTATMAVRLLKTGLFKKKGIIPPELIGRHPKCVSFVLKGLRERGLNYIENIQ